MAGRSATTERVNWALELLMAGRGSTAVVTELSQREGISRRQAQRITAKAHEILVTDLDQTERKHLVAQLVHILMEAAAKSASVTALQASYVVTCAVLERYYADVCSSNDREVLDRDGRRPAHPFPLSHAASNLCRSTPSSSSAGTAESLPAGCCALVMSWAWAASSACTISMPKP
jgi:hypothetical protein